MAEAAVKGRQRWTFTTAAAVSIGQYSSSRNDDGRFQNCQFAAREQKRRVRLKQEQGRVRASSQEDQAAGIIGRPDGPMGEDEGTIVGARDDIRPVLPTRVGEQETAERLGCAVSSICYCRYAAAEVRKGKE